MLQTNGMKFFQSLVAATVSLSLLLTPSAALYAQSALPNLGDDSAMTLGAERQLGDRIAREIYQDAEYLADPVLDAYLFSIWQPLYAQAKRSGAMPPDMDVQFAWRAFLVRDKSVNAFALPGGYFGTHLGLIAQAETPDALASVLAHEITHITQRHISRGMSKERAAAPLLVASLLVGLLAMRSNPQVASAALATGQAASIQGQLNFSRDFEREADRIGFSLMQPAGYSEQGFVDMFDLLGKASRLSDSGNYPYLRSHPLTTERVADMRARVGEKKLSPLIDAGRLQLHRLMAARAGVMADLSVDAQKFYLAQGEGAQPASDGYIATQYSAALAAWQLKDAPRAMVFYTKLKAATSIRTAPAVLEMVKWLGAELKQPTELDIRSPNRVEMLYAAQQLLDKKGVHPDELPLATSRLQDWVSGHPTDAQSWSLLSNLQLAQNKRVRGAMAQAEALRAQLDNGGALAQYVAAQNLIRQGLPTDTVDAAIVDSKVRELQQIVREASLKSVR